MIRFVLFLYIFYFLFYKFKFNYLSIFVWNLTLIDIDKYQKNHDILCIRSRPPGDFHYNENNKRCSFHAGTDNNLHHV